jgi:hypothetical protein
MLLLQLVLYFWKLKMKKNVLSMFIGAGLMMSTASLYANPPIHLDPNNPSINLPDDASSIVNGAGQAVKQSVMDGVGTDIFHGLLVEPFVGLEDFGLQALLTQVTDFYLINI